MTLSIPVAVSFMLVLARSSAWVMSAPIFSAHGIAGLGRLAMALSLSIFLAPIQAERMGEVPGDLIPFVILLVGQVLVGLLLGWATGILLRAFEAAGAMIDLSSGFSLGAIIDPLSGTQSAVFARFANMLFVTLLVATGAHLVLIQGFVRSFDALPAGAGLSLGEGAAVALTGAVGGLLLAAIEIGAPVLGVLFLTEVVLAVAARFAPQANVFLVGLPLKVGVALLAMGTALIYLPAHLEGLVESSLRLGSRVLGG